MAFQRSLLICRKPKIENSPKEASKMSQPPPTNIAASFYYIHKIITRGLSVSIENVQDAVQHGFRDDGRRQGLFTYIRALSLVLNSHHLTEDEIAFPYFRGLLPGAPFDRLIKGHQEMVKILDALKLLLEKCEKGDRPEVDLGNLENALIKLNATWVPHIRMETEGFISKADALVPVEEQLRLVGLFSQHGMKNTAPHHWAVPFLLFNLPPEDRQVFSQGMPAEIIQNLVPVVWKERWESMAPFFLE
jgi:hypothetical protein